MYKLHISPFGDHTRYDFEHETAGHRFSVVPDFGATLLSLCFGDQETIEGYPDAESLVANKWSKSALLCPFPNRLEDGEYTLGGQTYRFPLTNPATNNAIHGFVKDKNFDIVQTEATAERALLICTYRYDGSYEPYPFPFTLTARLSMEGPNGDFSFSLAMTNTGDRNIPAGLGWHPYFRITDSSDDSSLQMPDTDRIEVSDRMLPTGVRTPFTDYRNLRRIGTDTLDNCFALPPTDGRAELLLANDRGTLCYWQTTGPDGSNYVQVFTPPHRLSVAIEPMTCNVNAFRNRDGLIMLGPQTTLYLHCGLRFRPHV